MLRQLSSVVEDRTVTNIFIFLSKFSQVLDAYNDSNTLQSSFWPPGTRTNQRSNALMGYLFSMQLSNEESMGEPKDTAESLAGALSDWRPLSLSKPSTMEYLAATSFCNWTHVKMITKPSFTTVDTMALQGLVLSRRNQHKYAAELLNSTTGVITSQYGSCSMQVGIVTAELANCYNILRQENKAESRIITTLQERDGRSLSTRRDTIYLGLALSDSLIGRARYSQAVPVLESIIDSHDVSAKLRMMGVLRLARSRRRMHEDTQSAFEENSPLWTGLTLLSQAPEALTMEYVEELGCSISEIPKQQLQSSKQVQELIKAVDFVMCGSGYLADSPCREWYTKVRQEYLRQISVSSKAKEGKEVDDGSRNEVENGLGTPLSPHTSAHSPPGADDEMSESDDKGPWSEKLILTFGINIDPSIQFCSILTVLF
ncbi:hypothetical protein H9Q74_007404 [Fusarium xylarioides]|nr:hypothetical protein H9Q71_001410 [Fusarium xylarioides]KAG5822506.1 hypothetical protein H9Q74_007404 [Fusarium xylarioides]